MEIRKAQENDILPIVNLLKLSLGESLLPKSEAYWRWKHIDNPFGKSPVLVAESDGQLVGVRAFMPWIWHDGKHEVRAIRAVDTATHPNFQGKGIFKELTTQLVQKCKEDGYQLIFNTPNKQSKPGYLKMGWHVAGKPLVKMKIVRPFGLLNQLLGTGGETESFLNEYKISDQVINSFYQYDMLSPAGFKTYLHKDYIAWRYQKVPTVEYGVLTDFEGFWLFFRIKHNRWGVEMRIADIFITSYFKKADFLSIFKGAVKNLRPHMISCSAFVPSVIANVLKSMLFVRVSWGSPEVTVNYINGDQSHIFDHFNQWSPALGDLELF